MTVIVCDDHALVRRALGALLADLIGPDIATACDFAEAWAIAEAHDDVELCVVDLHMPGMTPIEGISGLQQRAPGAKLIVVTGSDDDQELLDTLALGIDGYVPKTMESGVIEAAIRLVMAGGRYLPERMAEIANSGSTPNSCAAKPQHPTPEHRDFAARYGKLTQRHMEVSPVSTHGTDLRL